MSLPERPTTKSQKTAPFPGIFVAKRDRHGDNLQLALSIHVARAPPEFVQAFVGPVGMAIAYPFIPP